MRHFLTALFCAALFVSFTSHAESQGKKKPKTPPIWSDQKDAFGDALPIGAIARIGTVRYRLPESRSAFGAIASPDGKLLAGIGIDNEISVWELPAWKLQRVITGRSLDKKNAGRGQLQGLAFSADSKKLVTCDIDTLKMYVVEIASGKALKKISLPERNAPRDSVLKLSDDEKTLVCVSINDTPKGASHHLVVLDLAKDKVRLNVPLPIDQFNDGRPSACVSADCRWLAQSVAEDPNNKGNRGVESYIELWDLTTGKSVRKIELETPMLVLAMAPDGKWLAASNGSSVLRIYEASTGKEVHNIRGKDPIQHLQFAADGALYVGGYSGEIQRWDAASGERTASWQAPGRFGVGQLMFPPQGKMLALGMQMDAVQLWEVETGKLFSPKDLPADPISEVEFSPQGDLFVATEGGMTAWWNPRTGVKLRDLKLELREEDRGVRFYRGDIDFPQRREIGGRRGFNDGLGGLLALSPNTEFLATTNGGGVAFYDAKTGKLLYEDDADLGRGGSTEIAFIDGGSKAASMTNKKVRIWNTRTGRDVASHTIPLRADEQSVRFAASSAGKYFAVETINRQAENGGGRVVLYDAVQKKMLREWPTQNTGVDAMQFSPDQQWLAVARPGEKVQLTRVAAVRADHELGAAKQQEPVDVDFTQIVFSPDSRQLACASLLTPENGRNSGKIHIYEIASKKIRLELVGHPAGIIDRLAYSPDSGLLVSGATDTTALVWKAGLRGFAQMPRADDAPADELAGLFTKMSGADAKIAFQSMIQLARTPAQTVKMLDEKIAPAKKPDTGDKSIKQWIHDLGSGQFAVRTKANQMLQKIGPAAEPDLRAALPNAADIETRRRIEELLDRLALHQWTAEEITHARAVEVLEAIGTPEVRAVLTRWTTGDPAAILTIEARKALATKEK